MCAYLFLLIQHLDTYDIECNQLTIGRQQYILSPIQYFFAECNDS